MATSRVRDCVNAAVDALKVDAALIALVGADKIHTYIKKGTDPPYTMIMGGDEIPWVTTFESFGDSGDNGGRQVDVLVQCVSTYHGTKEVDSIASRVLEVLTNEATYSGVTGFQLAEFVRNGFQPPIDLNSDGVLWFVRLVAVRVSLI